MIQASVNIAAIQSNKKRKNKDQTLAAAASDGDCISDRMISRAHSDHSMSKKKQQILAHLNGSPAAMQVANESGVPNLSPQKSMLHEQQLASQSRSQTINTILQQDVIELDAFDDDIPVTNFKKIEKTIGNLDKKALKKAGGAAGLKSYGSNTRSQMNKITKYRKRYLL